MYELLVSEQKPGFGAFGLGNMEYDKAVDKGAYILHGMPNALVIIRPVITHKSILADIKKLIQTNPVEDYEGYVWNCLLFDGGTVGADAYEITIEEFRQITLNALDELMN